MLLSGMHVYVALTYVKVDKLSHITHLGCESTSLPKQMTSRHGLLIQASILISGMDLIIVTIESAMATNVVGTLAARLPLLPFFRFVVLA
jgi:hypothetical protein